MLSGYIAIRLKKKQPNLLPFPNIFIKISVSVTASVCVPATYITTLPLILFLNTAVIVTTAMSCCLLIILE